MQVEQVCGCGGYQVVTYDPESSHEREAAQVQLSGWRVNHRQHGTTETVTGSPSEAGSTELRGL